MHHTLHIFAVRIYLFIFLQILLKQKENCPLVMVEMMKV